MDTNTCSLRPSGPREVALDTAYGRVTYLEQLARPPHGPARLVRWRGALDGAPIDRERIDALVLAHAIDSMDLSA